LQLTLKQLDNFKYDHLEYGGMAKDDHIQNNVEIAASIFNGIYKALDDDVSK